MIPMIPANLAVSISMPQWAVALLVVGFLFISVVMILIVLIQRPQGGGLSGAFGGGGGSAGQTAFGARTGDALTISTITIFILYLLAAIFLNYTIAPPAIENPSITAASETTGDEGEADDSVTFTEIPATVDGDGEADGASPIEVTVEEIPPATTDTDTPSDTPDDAPATDPNEG